MKRSKKRTRVTARAMIPRYEVHTFSDLAEQGLTAAVWARTNGKADVAGQAVWLAHAVRQAGARVVCTHTYERVSGWREENLANLLDAITQAAAAGARVLVASERDRLSRDDYLSLGQGHTARQRPRRAVGSNLTARR